MFLFFVIHVSYSACIIVTLCLIHPFLTTNPYFLLPSIPSFHSFSVNFRSFISFSFLWSSPLPICLTTFSFPISYVVTSLDKQNWESLQGTTPLHGRLLHSLWLFKFLVIFTFVYNPNISSFLFVFAGLISIFSRDNTLYQTYSK